MGLKFDKAYNANNGRYDWPSVSCISMIKSLSDDACLPDYSEYEGLTEAKALAKIKKMKGNNFQNYISVHEKAMSCCWEKVKDDGLDFEEGDVIFAKAAYGSFRNLTSMKNIVWQSDPNWPATLFFDGKLFWTYVPGENGLKVVVSFDDIIAVFRRK